jgi:hypothetical protein
MIAGLLTGTPRRGNRRWRLAASPAPEPGGPAACWPLACQHTDRRYSAGHPRLAQPRRGGRAAQGARLESVYTGNRIEASNPSPSAKTSFALLSSDTDAGFGSAQGRSALRPPIGPTAIGPYRDPHMDPEMPSTCEQVDPGDVQGFALALQRLAGPASPSTRGPPS